MLKIQGIKLTFFPVATWLLNILDHVSYSVPRPIHRLMHRSMYRSLLDRPSTDTRLTCRSTLNRCFGRAPTMSAEVSIVTIWGAYRSTTGRISVNYRWSVGRVSFDSRARVYRYYLPIYRPILSVILDTIHRYMARYLILSTNVSTNV